MDVPSGKPRRVLYVGDMWRGSTAQMRMHAMRELGFEVVALNTWQSGPEGRTRHPIRYLARKGRRPLDPLGVNRRIREMDGPVDILLLDKCLEVRPSTLACVKRKWPACAILGYSPDDMAQRHNNSAFFLACLPMLNGFITPKSFNVAELRELGARQVVFVNKGYDPTVHRPPTQSVSTTTEVGFVGTFEAERARSIRHLAQAGIPVGIRGNGWERWAAQYDLVDGVAPPVYHQDYVEQIWRTRINLCFLRKLNRDRQTARTMEIPACGGFMLAERTPEHEALFVEGVEAEYFGSDDELEEKVRWYLAHEDERAAIAAAGRERCIRSGYSYSEQFRCGLEKLGISVSMRD